MAAHKDALTEAIENAVQRNKQLETVARKLLCLAKEYKKKKQVGEELSEKSPVAIFAEVTFLGKANREHNRKRTQQ